MFGSMNLETTLISCGLGLLLGLLVIICSQFPKSSKTFVLLLLLNIISPFIGSSTYLIGYGPSYNLSGIMVAPTIFMFLLVINLSFLYRRFRTIATVSERI